MGRRQPSWGGGGGEGACKKQQVLVVIELKPGTITSALTFGLPDLAKPFTLYMTEKDKMAMGVLSQAMGTWDIPMAYLSKRLDNVATGWL